MKDLTKSLPAVVTAVSLFFTLFVLVTLPGGLTARIAEGNWKFLLVSAATAWALAYFASLTICLLSAGLSILITERARLTGFRLLFFMLTFLALISVYADQKAFIHAGLHLPEFWTGFFSSRHSAYSWITNSRVEDFGVTLQDLTLIVATLALTAAAFSELARRSATLIVRSSLQKFLPAILVIQLAGAATWVLFSQSERGRNIQLAHAATVLRLSSEEGREKRIVLTPPSTYPLKEAGTATETSSAPNIILVIIESIRADAATNEYMPLTLSHKHIKAENHFSGANCTHLGIVSLLYGSNAAVWPTAREKKAGSAYLKWLKTAGYDLRAYGASSFSWGGLREQVLEPDFSDIREFKQGEKFERDYVVVDQFFDTVKSARSPWLQILALESTHFPYSFPSDTVRFEPYLSHTETIATNRPDKARLANRYWNSISFIDRLLHDLLTRIESDPALKDTLIIVTGDHGEELLEEGKVGHGSLLNDMQTRVPLLMFGKTGNLPENIRKATAHEQILPTVLASVWPDTDFSGLGTGRPFQDDDAHPLMIAHCADVMPTYFAAVDDTGIYARGYRTGTSRFSLASEIADGSVRDPEEASDQIIAKLDYFGTTIASLEQHQCFIHSQESLEYILCTERKNWFAAQVSCQGMDATLADIRTMEEQEFLSAAMASVSTDSWWIGLSRSDGPGFVWTDGQPAEFTYWADNQPGMFDRCVVAYQRTGYGWNDLRCGINRPFACVRRRQLP